MLGIFLIRSAKTCRKIEILALILAAIIHDLEVCSFVIFRYSLAIRVNVVIVFCFSLQHDGFNNNFHKLVASGMICWEYVVYLGNSISGSDRAILHNDRSIQENHHVMSVFAIMNQDKSLDFLEVSFKSFDF